MFIWSIKIGYKTWDKSKNANISGGTNNTTSEFKIDNSGKLSNQYDTIPFSIILPGEDHESIGKCYSEFDLTLNLNIKEYEDGYQYIFVYKDACGSLGQAAEVRLEHRGPSKVSTNSEHIVEFRNIELDDFTGDSIVLRYGDQGNFVTTGEIKIYS